MGLVCKSECCRPFLTFIRMSRKGISVRDEAAVNLMVGCTVFKYNENVCKSSCDPNHRTKMSSMNLFR